ncbi:MAG: hypothetical protein LUP94_02555 [Candidatus Methanomethylicus sp.]|nr:hypothetical protein [Candidatus Methanomethylicus sp.]
MTFLDVLVDGEVVKEAMLVDHTEGEELLYKGPNLDKGMKRMASFLVGRLPQMHYCIFSTPNHKYVIIPMSSVKFLMLGLASDVNAENYVTQIKKILDEVSCGNYKKIA